MDTKPDSSQQQYFRSYEELEVHKLMLEDKPRTETYQRAILQNSELFKGKVVLDVGAGTGILSLFCARAGAAKVFAIEASHLASLTKKVVEENNYSDIIEVIEGKAEEVDLPDNCPVDIIVSEWMGFYLLHESMLKSVIRARDKHLKEDGCMLPSHAHLYAAPCNLRRLWNDQFWDDVYGFSMKSVSAQMKKSRTCRPEIFVVKPEELIAEREHLLKFDLRQTSIEDIESFTVKRMVSTTTDGSFDGICLWFDCDFTYPVVVGKHERLSTSPHAPPTHWKQTVVTLPSSFPVEKDEVIGFSIEFSPSAENCRWYNISVTLLDPLEDDHPVPCNCGVPKCRIIKAFLEKEQELEVT